MVNSDIFENKILCKDCNKEMELSKVVRNGFKMRMKVCRSCGNKIIHPEDKREYKDFLNLKNKTFRVKLRLVGNSYAVSIPKEIVKFINGQEKIMDNMVRLCFEDFKKLNLMFGDK